MQPGLHPLQCSRCGAPLDPSDRSQGDVISCEHCGQPHLWISPGKVEAHSAAHARPSQVAPRLVLALVGIAAFVFALGVTGIYIMRRAPAGSMYASITADMPIAVPDELYMQIDSHSCELRVESVLDDGRLLAIPCNAREAAPLDRRMIAAETFDDRASFR